jgi:adenosylcobinamide-phosphate synthase
MSLVAGTSGPEPLLLLSAALVLDAVLPGAVWPFRFIPHPVRWIGRLADALESRFNRSNWSAAARRVSGAVLASVLSAGAVGFAAVVGSIGRGVPYGWLIELALVTSLFAQRSLFVHVSRVAEPLAMGDLGRARLAVAEIVGRDPDNLDRHAIARAAIESLAENFSDGVLAPVLWYACFGLPGLLVYKTINTLDSMWGHRSERFAAFGFAAARLDDGLNLVPARLSGALLALAALFVPKAQPVEAWRSMWRDARKHRSVNAGWPESAVAGALDLALAGPRRYGETLVDDSWMGGGRREAEPADITRALGLYVAACVLVGLGVLGAAWLMA